LRTEAGSSCDRGRKKFYKTRKRKTDGHDIICLTAQKTPNSGEGHKSSPTEEGKSQGITNRGAILNKNNPLSPRGVWIFLVRCSSIKEQVSEKAV